MNDYKQSDTWITNFRADALSIYQNAITQLNIEWGKISTPKIPSFDCGIWIDNIAYDMRGNILEKYCALHSATISRTNGTLAKFWELVYDSISPKQLSLPSKK